MQKKGCDRKIMNSIKKQYKNNIILKFIGEVCMIVYSDDSSKYSINNIYRCEPCCSM